MQYNVSLHAYYSAERPAARVQSPSNITTSLSRFSSAVAIVLYKADRKV